MLNIAHTCVTEGINGPGRRFTVWVQGCRRTCRGCFNPGLQPREDRLVLTPQALAQSASSGLALEGVTLSGGEPFEQAEGLTVFLDELRARPGCASTTAIAFTGFTLEELRGAGRPDWESLLGRLDLLVDGPFREAEAAELTLRGSRNQRLIALTPAGEELFRQIESAPPGGFEATITDDGEIILTGFPPETVVEGLRCGLSGPRMLPRRCQPKKQAPPNGGALSSVA